MRWQVPLATRAARVLVKGDNGKTDYPTIRQIATVELAGERPQDGWLIDGNFLAPSDEDGRAPAFGTGTAGAEYVSEAAKRYAMKTIPGAKQAFSGPITTLFDDKRMLFHTKTLVVDRNGTEHWEPASVLAYTEVEAVSKVGTQMTQDNPNCTVLNTSATQITPEPAETAAPVKKHRAKAA